MARLIQGTRIQLICPCGTYEEYEATSNVIAFLMRRRRVREWGGFTHSSLDNPGFAGYFWDTEGGRARWVRDRNVLILVDAPRHAVAELLPYLRKVRREMNEMYRVATGTPQKSLWITFQSLQILDDE